MFFTLNVTYRKLRIFKGTSDKITIVVSTGEVRTDFRKETKNSVYGLGHIVSPFTLFADEIVVQKPLTEDMRACLEIALK
jgi:hypothetical protein